MDFDSGTVCTEDVKKTANEFAYMSKPRIIKNLLVLSLAFLLLFSAFMGLTNLQSTINSEDNVGVISQSAIYVAFIISSCLLPPLMIRKFGSKLTIGMSILAYSPFIAGNFYATSSTLLPTAVLLGTAGGTLWCSASTYINDLSFMDAKGDAKAAELSTSRFFGIFQAAWLATQILGNLVSYYVLRPSETSASGNYSSATNFSQYVTHGNVTCGPEFCGGISQKPQAISSEKRVMLIGIYLAFSLIAAVVILLFLDSLRERPDEKEGSNLLPKLAATLRHMKKIDQLLLIILSVYCGLQQGFIFGDYSEAYVACSLGLENVGLVFVCFGAVDAITALCAGKLLKHVPRVVLMIIAAASNSGVCAVLLCWQPSLQHAWAFYALVGFWGVSDALWQTQLSALYGTLFREDEEAAFANYRGWEAAGWLIAFACSGYICTTPKIYMQFGFLAFGMVGYIALEVLIFQRTSQKGA